MKVYADYNGEVPAGVVVVKEGTITRIYFDYEHITKVIDVFSGQGGGYFGQWRRYA